MFTTPPYARLTLAALVAAVAVGTLATTTRLPIASTGVAAAALPSTMVALPTAGAPSELLAPAFANDATLTVPALIVVAPVAGGGARVALVEVQGYVYQAKVGLSRILERLGQPVMAERLAREMIFCARRFGAKEAVEIGLINKCVPASELRKETLAWCETIKGHSPQTLRMTKKSLNFESDLLYASWQHGMELLAHVWGSEESLEGMNAFLEGRKPDFQKFRMRSKRELEEYLAGCVADLNAPPSMRRKAR